MKRLLMLIPLILLCCLGCQKGEGPATVDSEVDIQAIKDIVAGINAAANVSDVEKFMSFYADDAISIGPNEPATIGKEAIRRDVQQFFDEFTGQEEDVVKVVHVSGDLAVAYVTWSGVATPKAGGELMKGNGNMIMVFERQPDGAWKTIYMIWSDESLINPEQAE